MNIATSRFTISTMAVAACAMAALAATEPAQAQSTAPAVQRIEIIGQRLAPVQQIVIVGRRLAQAPVQRIVIVGQRQRDERVAMAEPTAPRR